MSINRRTFAATAFVLAITSVSACGSSDTTSNSPSSPAVSTSKPATPTTAAPSKTPTPVPTQSSSGQYIVVLADNEGDNVYELQLIDPVTNEIVQRRPFSYNNDTHAVFQDNYTSGSQRRCAFDPGFTAVAVQQDNEAADENDTIAKVFIDPNNAVGLFPAIAEAQSSGISVRIKRGVPAFSGDRLYYVQNDSGKRTLMSVGNDGLARTEKNDNAVSRIAGDSKPFYFWPHSSVPQYDFDQRAAYSQDGTDGFRPSRDGSSIEYGDLDHNKVSKVSIPTKDGSLLNVDPVAYLDKTSYITVNNKDTVDKVSTLYKVTVNNGTLTRTKLAAGSGDFVDPTVSDDGHVAFLYKEESKTSLHTVSAQKPDWDSHIVYTFTQSGSTPLNVLDWQQVTIN